MNWLEKLRRRLSVVIYVRVTRNRFLVRDIFARTEVEARPTQAFSSERLLVGDFVVAEALLKSTISKLASSSLFAVSPVVVIHPMELLEGGLSQVEERAIRELAAGAGARKVVVWVGKRLSDEDVLEKIGL